MQQTLIPVGSNLQCQLHNEWNKLKDYYQRGDWTNIFNLFRTGNKHKYVLDVLSPEGLMGTTWYIQFLWSIYIKSYYYEHKEKVDVKLSREERLLILLYYLTWQITSVNNTHGCRTLDTDLQKMGENLEASSDIQDLDKDAQMQYKKDVRQLLTLANMFENNFYDMAKGLASV